MNKEQIRRGKVVLMALLFLFASAFPLSSLADGDGSADAAAARPILDAKVVDLGTVPDETASEIACDVLIVADITTGALLHEKNIAAKMPVSGAIVQLMAVLTALDYISLDDVVSVSEALAETFPTEGSLLGLAAGSKVYAGDLIAGMLFVNAADAAIVLEKYVQSRAKVAKIGQLMADKAASLGMTDTDYSLYNGAAQSPILTTALDQCRLYLAALECETLREMLQNAVYPVRSKLAFATPTPEPTPVPKRKKKQAVAPNPNDALPDQLVNAVSAVVPESVDYDVRLSSAVSGSTSSYQKQYGVTFLRAVEYRSDLAILYWSQADALGVAAKTCTDLAEIFSRRKIVDLVPYLQAASNSLSVEKNGLTIGGWSLAENYVLYGRQMVGYDPDLPERAMPSFDLSKMTVRLQTDASTLVTNEDGSRSIRAIVLINNEIADTVTLSTATKTQKADTATQDPVEMFTDDDVMPAQPSLMAQYGWFILMCAAVLLAMIVIIIGVLIRNRMER